MANLVNIFQVPTVLGMKVGVRGRREKTTGNGMSTLPGCLGQSPFRLIISAKILMICVFSLEVSWSGL